MNKLYLGIDTSNYKTSIAITDANDEIVYERSEFLEVEQGERGLRQSVAFFKHSNALPLFIEEAANKVDFSNLAAISVSTRPRRVEGSYMPVFLAGENAARQLAAALDAPLYRFSHQEGHVHAVLTSYSSELLDADNCDSKCIMYHLSGGTSEILLCEKDAEGYRTEIIGGTKDISIGQLLDRIGVKLGFPFPSGSYLDKIASKILETREGKKSSVQIKAKDCYFNLSGLETQAMRIIEAASEDEIESEIEEYIADIFIAIAKLIFNTANESGAKFGVNKVYIAGGVAASSTIRELIKEYNAGGDISIIFGDARLSGDNAVGIARLGRINYENK